MIPRGTIVVTALPGEHGKPRPALVVQAEAANILASCIVCPLTTYDEGSPTVRVPIHPSDASGLERPSYVMVDKIIAMPRAKVDRRIGAVMPAEMEKVDRVLALILGLA